MEKTSSDNKILDNIDRSLSQTILSQGYLYCVTNLQNIGSITFSDRLNVNIKLIILKILNLTNYTFRFNKKIDAKFLNFELETIIKKITLSVAQSLNKIALDKNNLQDGNSTLSPYRTAIKHATDISRKIKTIYERYEKNQEIASWTDLQERVIALVPSVEWSWKSPSTWPDLVYSSPKTFLKTMSLLKVCVKTFRCWFSDAYKDENEKRRRFVKKSFEKFNEMIEPFKKNWEDIDKYETNLQTYKTVPSKENLQVVLRSKIEVNKQVNIPEGTTQALEVEKGLKLPNSISAINDLIKLLEHPMSPNFGNLLKDIDPQVLQFLSTYATNENLKPLERRHFLGALVERLVAHQLFKSGPLPYFALEKSLPTSFDEQIKLLLSIYQDIDIKGLKDNGATLPSFNDTSIVSQDQWEICTKKFAKTKKNLDLSLKDKFKDFEKEFAKLIQNPRCVNFFALAQEEISEEKYEHLSTLALSEHLNAPQRSYFLKSLLEMTIAQHLFGSDPIPEFGLKQHLPTEMKGQIELLRKIYENQNIDDLLVKNDKKLPSFNPTEFLNHEVSHKVLEAIYEQEKNSFENISELLVASCLSIDSLYLGSFIKKIISNEKSESDPKMIVVNLNQPSETLWNDLLKLAENNSVKHIYLQGTKAIAIPPEDILWNKSLQILLKKIRVNGTLYVKPCQHQKSNREMIALLSTFSPIL